MTTQFTAFSFDAVYVQGHISDVVGDVGSEQVDLLSAEV